MSVDSVGLSGTVSLEASVILFAASALWLLYGVLVVQIYLYFMSFPNDFWLVKIMVSVITALDTFLTIFLTKLVFANFTSSYGAPLANQDVGNWFSLTLVFGLVEFMVHMYYDYRIAVFTRSRLAAVSVFLFALFQLGTSITLVVRVSKARILSDILNTVNFVALTIAWGGSSITCDTVIAAVMIYHLKKRDNGIKQTHTIIGRLIRLTITTGLLTASWSIVTLLLVVCIPGRPPYYQAASLILTKMYPISVIASLNSRVKVVSNATGGPPHWNESARTHVTFSELRNHSGLVFFRDEGSRLSLP